jgi:protocatechuate 3,4-dioxygenase, beta subunit
MKFVLLKHEYMKTLFLFLCLVAITTAGCTQNNTQKQAEKNEQRIGGGCEGCEAIYETPVPFEKLSWIDTLPDFSEPGPKLEISGIVYKKDGKTPAPDVVLYIYHTDQNGKYATKGDETGWGKRHGYIRGWVKTNDQGQYKFYTLVPASYPNSNNPKHIHPTIKEPGKNEYWIDEFVFANDPLFHPPAKNHQPRGGDGVLHVKESDGMLKATHNIVLGLNVPDYRE